MRRMVDTSVTNGTCNFAANTWAILQQRAWLLLDRQRLLNKGRNGFAIVDRHVSRHFNHFYNVRQAIDAIIGTVGRRSTAHDRPIDPGRLASRQLRYTVPIVVTGVQHEQYHLVFILG